MTSPDSPPEPLEEEPRTGDTFQQLLDSGALERVAPSSPEESTYKLHVEAIQMLRPPESSEPPKPKAAPHES